MTDDDIEKMLSSDGQYEDEKFLEKKVAEIMEKFDSVQIFATRYTPGDGNKSVSVTKGNGEWYARVGLVKDWIIRQDECTRINEREQEE